LGIGSKIIYRIIGDKMTDSVPQVTPTVASIVPATLAQPVRTHRALSLVRQDVPEISDLNHKFQQHIINLDEVKVVKSTDYSDRKSAGSRTNLRATQLLLPSGETKLTSDRFWTSLASKAGFSTNIFDLFTHEEVFDRIKERKKLGENSTIRFVEHVTNNELLAVSAPDKACVHYNTALELIKRYNGEDVRYAEGMIYSIHDLPNGAVRFIKDEEFLPKIYVEIPIDGYGNVNTYITLMRTKCSNGMVAMTKAFKSTVNLGSADSDYVSSIERMFSSFSNDEGYDALSQRLQIAMESTLSVEEFMKIYRVIAPSIAVETANAERTTGAFTTSELIRKKFQALAGDLHKMYGVVNLDALSSKQRSILQTKCTVFDAFNFLTELATHILTRARTEDAKNSKKIYALIGDMLAGSYDLEGVPPEGKSTKDFPDFYFSLDSQSEFDKILANDEIISN